MKDTENNKDSKKFTLKKLDYTENMVELMSVITVLGVQIAQIEKSADAPVRKNLLKIINNIEAGLAKEPSYDKEKAKQIIEKRGTKLIKFDAYQDKTGLLRQVVNSSLDELTGIKNLTGRNLEISQGVEDHSNIFTTIANKLSFGVISKDLKVSKETQDHIQKIATISQDFADAVHPKERAFYLQQMNDELNKLVKSKDNDMKWDKSFKAYLTEFVESFQKFLTVTAPSLFKKQITEDKKFSIIYEAQQQLDVQKDQIYKSLTAKEKEAIQFTYSKRKPNNIGNMQDFEKDLLDYKQDIKQEEKTEQSKNFLRKTGDKIGKIISSPEKTSVGTFAEADLKSAQNKMDQCFELMRQKKQLANYVTIDPTQKALNAAHSNNKQYQKEQSLLLHLLDETQQPLKDRTQNPGMQALGDPQSSKEAQNLIANLCKKIPPVEDAAVISGHKGQTGLNNQVKLQQQAALRQNAPPLDNKPTVAASNTKTKNYMTLEQLEAQNNNAATTQKVRKTPTQQGGMIRY
jgi:hemerythrin-like domain-containing protein